MSSLQYERLCLLFNIGVLQGQIAAAQNFQSDEGLKTAAKMFQVNSTDVTFFRSSFQLQLKLKEPGDSSQDFPALIWFWSHLKF